MLPNAIPDFKSCILDINSVLPVYTSAAVDVEKALSA